MREYMSFGGGVQSTAIALLAINKDERLLKATGGKLPELYVFADTGDEPDAVYENVASMQEMIEGSGAEFKTVYRYDEEERRKLSNAVCNPLEKQKQGGIPWIPAFVESDTSPMPIMRRCTYTYKVEAVHRSVRAHFKVPRGCKEEIIRAWIGISVDEIQRMRDSREKWQGLFYPLVKMGWRRGDCSRYIEQHKMDPTRSACVYCPFRNNREWEEMRQHNPNDFKRAVEFEKRLHAAYDGLDEPLLKSKPFIHRSRKRLDEVDFTGGQLDLPLGMQNECLGMCGV